MATIAVLGALDTNGVEHQFVADCISRHGHQALLIDVGTQGAPQVNPHISREAVAKVAELDLASMGDDPARAQDAMRTAAPIILSTLFRQGKIQGVISLGEGGDTAIATSGMCALPLGFPKLIVSTLANGNTAQYAGAKDIVMMPSIVDVAGLNRISRPMLTRAAGAICGMVETAQVENGAQDQPLIFATVFGNTTSGVSHARSILEGAGYEIIMFHATGVGGRAMEALLETGVAAGV
ncbi:MAG: Tm-1-like ATP-binding domain-containing protein, partial [Chthoniobacteraceae bacterium]|nr:Tm-1-like ATP-binding domain-containing protein [Chthoniobacteraceae bacterium]